METRTPVRRYFDSRASHYAERSAGLLWRWLRARETRVVMRMASVRPGEEILDAGSGSGHYTSLLVEAGARVTALDFSSSMLLALRQRLSVDTIEGDLEAVSLKPKYDKILCVGALEFVPNPPTAVANLARGLQVGGPGEMILMVPARTLVGRLYRLFHRGHGIQVNLFTRVDLEELVRQAEGFRIDGIQRVTFNFVLRLRRVSRTFVN